MKVEGLGWLGIRTERFGETARFFREVMDLEETRTERDVIGGAFPDGAKMEIWRPGDEFRSFFGTGPVVGLRVDDVEEARAEMEAAGVAGFWGRYSARREPPGATCGGQTATSMRSYEIIARR